MGCGSSIHPFSISKDATYRLWSPVSKMGDGVMKRHPTENKVFCDGTFKEPDDNNEDKQYALKRNGNEITTEEKDKIHDKSHLFESQGFGGFRILKLFEEELYLGCDHTGEVTLVENPFLLYPNPQTLFILYKVRY
ncbi:uncharacterized protein [Pocillopora verrucosa]|uniref:uncharacterized protein isoform X3 n=1 Tax=Pocillopora verrucosa TaxID=203993 RepID=UPI00334263BA